MCPDHKFFLIARRIQEKIDYDGEYPDSINMAGAKLKLLGYGSYKVVYHVRCCDLVLKIGRDEYAGAREVGDEIAAWKKSSRPCRKHLAPIVKHGKGWIVSKYVQMFSHAGTQYDFNEFPAKFLRDHKEISTILYNYGIDTSDLHEWNVGYLNNRMVAVDYS